MCSHSAPCQGLLAARTAGSYVPLRHNPLSARCRPEYSSDGPSRERRRLLGTSMVVRAPCKFQEPKHASPRSRPLHPSRGRDWRSMAGVVRSLKVPLSVQRTVRSTSRETFSEGGLEQRLLVLVIIWMRATAPRGPHGTSSSDPGCSLYEKPPLAQTTQIHRFQDNYS